jgi:DNA-directed RNA polymerase specialized sigma24 family protein
MTNSKTNNKINTSNDNLVEVITKIAHLISRKFRFGYFDEDDIRQQIAVFSLEAIKKYNGEDNLFTFLYTHAHNRLINMKRDKFCRISPPCNTCKHSFCVNAERLCHKFDNTDDCKVYAKWVKRNDAKRSIAAPISLSMVTEDEYDALTIEDNKEAEIDFKDLLQKVEDKVPQNMRGLFLKMKHETFLTKSEKNKLKIIIEEIVGDNSRGKTNG